MLLSSHPAFGAPIRVKPIRHADYKQVPIRDCGQPMADIAPHGLAGHNYYHAHNNPPYMGRLRHSIEGLYLRTEVIHRLLGVNKLLAPYELEVYILDAYRPLALQQYIFNEWLQGYYAAEFPELSASDIAARIRTYWAEPPCDIASIDHTCTPPHLTGAAIDLTLRCKRSLRWLDMGNLFDDLSPVSAIDYFETHENLEQTMSFVSARNNRRILFWAMSELGFAYHPEEWWHYSYGDQVWAHQYGVAEAIYDWVER